MPDATQKLAIDTVRTLSMDAVQQAESGHPGTPMALAPLAYALYTRHVKHNPADPHWPDRDRVVLSAGHASMLLYSTLYLSGYDLTLDARETRPSMVMSLSSQKPMSLPRRWCPAKDAASCEIPSIKQPSPAMNQV